MQADLEEHSDVAEATFVAIPQEAVGHVTVVAVCNHLHGPEDLVAMPFLEPVDMFPWYPNASENFWLAATEPR